MKRAFVLLIAMLMTVSFAQLSFAAYDEMANEEMEEGLSAEDLADCKAMLAGEGLTDEEIKSLCEEMKAEEESVDDDMDAGVEEGMEQHMEEDMGNAMQE